MLIIALGCNSDHEACMEKAKKTVSRFFENNIVFTKMIWTLPVGIKSDKFLNCLALTRTELDFRQTEKALKQIEAECGDTKADRSRNIIRMDIDILLFGDMRFHIEDWKRDYVKELIREFAEFINDHNLTREHEPQAINHIS